MASTSSPTLLELYIELSQQPWTPPNNCSTSATSIFAGLAPPLQAALSSLRNIIKRLLDHSTALPSHGRLRWIKRTLHSSLLGFSPSNCCVSPEDYTSLDSAPINWIFRAIGALVRAFRGLLSSTRTIAAAGVTVDYWVAATDCLGTIAGLIKEHFERYHIEIWGLSIHLPYASLIDREIVPVLIDLCNIADPKSTASTAFWWTVKLRASPERCRTYVMTAVEALLVPVQHLRFRFPMLLQFPPSAIARLLRRSHGIQFSATIIHLILKLLHFEKAESPWQAREITSEWTKSFAATRSSQTRVESLLSSSRHSELWLDALDLAEEMAQQSIQRPQPYPLLGMSYDQERFKHFIHPETRKGDEEGNRPYNSGLYLYRLDAPHLPIPLVWFGTFSIEIVFFSDGQENRAVLPYSSILGTEVTESLFIEHCFRLRLSFQGEIPVELDHPIAINDHWETAPDSEDEAIPVHLVQPESTSKLPPHPPISFAPGDDDTGPDVHELAILVSCSSGGHLVETLQSRAQLASTLTLDLNTTSIDNLSTPSSPHKCLSELPNASKPPTLKPRQPLAPRHLNTLR